MTGLPIETYQLTHWCSSHDREVKSVPAYSSAKWSTTVEFIVRSGRGGREGHKNYLYAPGDDGGRWSRTEERI